MPPSVTTSAMPSGRLQPLLPPATRGRPRRWPLHRSLVDGVRHRVQVGCPVAGRARPVRAVVAGVRLVRMLAAAQVWVRIEAALRARADSAGRLSWQVSVDSTISRAHIHAAGARRDSTNRVAGEPDHHALGRSRGGWGTKTHAVIDQHRGVLAFLLTPGQDGDSPQMIPVLEMIRVDRPGPGRPRRRPQRVLADKAYSSKANRAWLRTHRIPTTIPVPADQVGRRRRRGSRGGRPPAFDPDTYKDRHAVECGFNILKPPPRIRRRYDKLAVRFAATVHVASIDHWLKRLT